MASRVGGPDFQPWTLFSLLEPPFLHSLRLSCVFGNLGNEAILITDADEVFALGSNGAGCLGLGDMSSTLEPKKVEALSGKGIVHLAYGSGPHVVASNKSGAVFTWGHNGYCQLGNGSTSQCYSPTQLEGALQNKFVTEVACGSHHSVCLTKDGDIYAWGQNNCGQIGTGTTTNQSTPRKVSSPFAGKKVTSISCGQTSTMVALESGEVYGWGYNGNGQLGLGNNINQLSPSRVASLQGCVIKVVCGYAHTLALSDEGELYGWGANSYGQLGTGNKANSCVPTRVAEDIGRVIDIAASHYNHISAAITQDSTVYMWGQCHGQSVVLPTPTSFVRLHDVFACFATPAVTPVPVVTEISSVPNIIDSLKLAFDDASTADVKFVVEGKEINVHKAILKIRCEHFRSMFQEHWEEGAQEAIEIHQFTYPVYRAFLAFLYTDEVNLSTEDAIGLLDLANAYCEVQLKKRCETLIKQGITVENVAMLYATAIKFSAEELEEFCFRFSLNHMTAMCQTEAFRRLDESIVKDFISKAAREGAFKS